MSSTDPFHDMFPLQSYEGWEPFDLLQMLDTGVVHAADPVPVSGSSESDDTPRETHFSLMVLMNVVNKKP